MKPCKLLTTMAAALALAACGGGRDDDTAAVDDTTVPASATASVAAFNGYVGAQAASETREPLLLGAITPPTSEADEPAVVR